MVGAKRSHEGILLDLFCDISFHLDCGGVFLFIFLEKTKQKIVVALESLRFQGRSPRHGTLCVINKGAFTNAPKR